MRRLARRLVFAQSIDALTFAAFMVLVGPGSVHVERNPLIAAIYALGGFALVGVVKVAVAAWVGSRSTRPLAHPRLVTVLLSVATASGIAGAGFNAASLVDVIR